MTENKYYIGPTERKVCIVWLSEMLEALDGDEGDFEDWHERRVPQLKSEMKAAIEIDRRNRPATRRIVDENYGYTDEQYP